MKKIICAMLAALMIFGLVSVVNENFEVSEIVLKEERFPKRP